MKPAAFEPVIPAIERPQTYVRVTTTLYPQPTQQSKTTFVWAYIVRHVWPLLIRHVRPDFCLQRTSFPQSAYCR